MLTPIGTRQLMPRTSAERGGVCGAWLHQKYKHTLTLNLVNLPDDDVPCSLPMMRRMTWKLSLQLWMISENKSWMWYTHTACKNLLEDNQTPGHMHFSRPQVDLTFERFRFLAPCQRLRAIVCVLSAHLRDDESSTCVCLRLREQCLRSKITSVSRVVYSECSTLAFCRR